jgi:hypothetical protein
VEPLLCWSSKVRWGGGVWWFQVLVECFLLVCVSFSGLFLSLFLMVPLGGRGVFYLLGVSVLEFL